MLDNDHHCFGGGRTHTVLDVVGTLDNDEDESYQVDRTAAFYNIVAVGDEAIDAAVDEAVDEAVDAAVDEVAAEVAEVVAEGVDEDR